MTCVTKKEIIIVNDSKVFNLYNDLLTITLDSYKLILNVN